MLGIKRKGSESMPPPPLPPIIQGGAPVIAAELGLAVHSCRPLRPAYIATLAAYWKVAGLAMVWKGGATCVTALGSGSRPRSVLEPPLISIAPSSACNGAGTAQVTNLHLQLQPLAGGSAQEQQSPLQGGRLPAAQQVSAYGTALSNSASALAPPVGAGPPLRCMPPRPVSPPSGWPAAIMQPSLKLLLLPFPPR